MHQGFKKQQNTCYSTKGFKNSFKLHLHLYQIFSRFVIYKETDNSSNMNMLEKFGTNLLKTQINTQVFECECIIMHTYLLISNLDMNKKCINIKAFNRYSLFCPNYDNRSEKFKVIKSKYVKKIWTHQNIFDKFKVCTMQ